MHAGSWAPDAGLQAQVAGAEPGSRPARRRRLAAPGRGAVPVGGAQVWNADKLPAGLIRARSLAVGKRRDMHGGGGPGLMRRGQVGKLGERGRGGRWSRRGLG